MIELIFEVHFYLNIVACFKNDNKMTNKRNKGKDYYLLAYNILI